MNWVALGLIGGVIGLDATSFPQAMWSRPLVAGTVAGLIMGNPVGGLLIGALLDIFALLILPFGAARYPESGTAAAAAAAAYATTVPAGVNVGILLLAVAFALAWEHIAGASVIFTRRINGQLVAGAPETGFYDRQITRRHLLALLIDFLRGSWAVLLGSLAGLLLLRALTPLLALDEVASTGVLIVAAAAMLGSAIPLFGGLRQRWLPLALGLLCGLLLVALQ